MGHLITVLHVELRFVHNLVAILHADLCVMRLLLGIVGHGIFPEKGRGRASGRFGGERVDWSSTCSRRQSFCASRSAHTTGYDFRLWRRWETRAGFQGLLVVYLRPGWRIRKVVFDYRLGLGHVRFRSFFQCSPSGRRRCPRSKTGRGWSRWPRHTTMLTLLAFLHLLDQTGLLLAIAQFRARLCERTMIQNRIARLLTVREIWSV
jgi:hypothetical protein